jgi:hypothetical protein
MPYNLIMKLKKITREKHYYVKVPHILYDHGKVTNDGSLV